MDYGQTKDSQVLHRPTIKGLYSGQLWKGNEVQKKLLYTLIGDSIYIIENMTKPGTDTKKCIKRL